MFAANGLQTKTKAELLVILNDLGVIKGATDGEDSAYVNHGKGGTSVSDATAIGTTLGHEVAHIAGESESGAKFLGAVAGIVLDEELEHGGIEDTVSSTAADTEWAQTNSNNELITENNSQFGRENVSELDFHVVSEGARQAIDNVLEKAKESGEYEDLTVDELLDTLEVIASHDVYDSSDEHSAAVNQNPEAVAFLNDKFTVGDMRGLLEISEEEQAILDNIDNTITVVEILTGVVGAGKAIIKNGDKVIEISKEVVDLLIKKFVKEPDELAKNAYEIAKEGGRHAGQLKQFLKQDAAQLNRSIRKFDKNIDKHEKWIAEPKSKIPEWDTFSAERQANTIHHWQQDIARARELQNIAKEVARQKGF